jgi:putative transposase
MDKDRMTLLETLRKARVDEDIDFLREGVKVLAESLMELEVKEKTGAGLYERNEDRVTYRNGYRERRRLFRK